MNREIIEEKFEQLYSGELSEQEENALLEEIRANPELEKEFATDLALWAKLKTLPKSQPFAEQMLEENRRNLDKTLMPRTFTLGAMISASVAACLTTAAAMFYFTAPNQEDLINDIVSYELKTDADNNLLVTGKTATPFSMPLDKPSFASNKVLAHVAMSDPNIGNRLVALEQLNNTPQNNFENVYSTILKEEHYIPLRLKALEGLREATIDSSLAALYTDILKSEQNKIIQMKIIEHLADKASEKQRNEIIKLLSN